MPWARFFNPVFELLLNSQTARQPDSLDVDANTLALFDDGGRGVTPATLGDLQQLVAAIDSRPNVAAQISDLWKAIAGLSESLSWKAAVNELWNAIAGLDTSPATADPAASIVFPAPITAVALGQVLITTYVPVAGLAFNLTKNGGRWIITAGLNFQQPFSVAGVSAKLQINGIDQTPTANAAIPLASGTAFLSLSQTWVFQPITGTELVQLFVQSTGANGGTITTLSTLTAFWYPS